MEVIDSVHFSQLIMDFEARLEKIFRQLQLFRFPVEGGHRCRERLCRFGNSVHVVMGICRIVVVCQLLKSQQILVCFNRRKGIFTVDLRLTGRAVLFLLS